MHRALSLPDILHIVCDHLIWSADGFPSQESQRDMLMLALTCKAFLPISLDTLWSHMRSLVPLMKLLPTFGSGYRGGLFVLKENVPPETWRVFDAYAARIRSLNHSRNLRTDPSVHEALLRWHPSPLLPRLRQLLWRGGDFSLSEAKLLQSPSLRHARFLLTEYPEQGGGVQTFLERLSETQLQELTLWGKIPPGCLTLVPRFQHLRMLYVWEAYRGVKILRDKQSWEDVQAGIYKSAFEMEQLTSLSLRLPLEYTYEFPERIALGNLDYLCLRGSVESLTPLFEVLSADQLWELNLTVDTHGSPEGCNYRGLLSKLRFPHLRVLELSTTNEDRAELALDYADIVEPLLGLRALENVLVNFPSDTVRLGDDDVLAMASAWPCLLKLRVVTANSDRPPVGAAAIPTLRALAYLARGCPELKSLELQIDASGAVPAPVSMDRDHGLRSLDMRCSPVGDARKVAVWLNGVFPSLEVGVSAKRGWGWGHVWNQICVLRVLGELGYTDVVAALG